MEGNFDLWETLTKPLQYIRLYTGDLATSNLGDLICSSCNLMPDYVTVNFIVQYFILQMQCPDTHVKTPKRDGQSKV